MIADEQERIKDLLSRDPKELITTNADLDLRVKDLRTLSPKLWLNDTVVNMYTALMEDKFDCFAMSSFWYGGLGKEGSTTQRWNDRKKRDVFERRYLLIPVCKHYHWTMIIVDHALRKISYYDSYRSKHEQYYEPVSQALKVEWDKKADRAEKWIEYTSERVMVCNIDTQNVHLFNLSNRMPLSRIMHMIVGYLLSWLRYTA